MLCKYGPNCSSMYALVVYCLILFYSMKLVKIFIVKTYVDIYIYILNLLICMYNKTVITSGLIDCGSYSSCCHFSSKLCYYDVTLEGSKLQKKIPQIANV